MSPAALLILGQRVGVRETVDRAGELLDIPYSSRWRRAAAEGWPLIGEPGAQRVLMIPWCELQGIPYQVITTDQTEEEASHE